MRKGWEYKRWKEVLTIINGKNQSAVVDENGEYPIYGSGGIMGYANNWLCPENCVIIGRKGNINKPIFVETKFWNVDTAFGLNANKEYLLPKFLYYFCLDYNFERHNKAVTIPSLTKVDLLKIDIPLPPKSTQLAIVTELDKINELIRLKKEQLKDFDNLAQSLFYEMFGDPVENEKGWEVHLLKTLCTKIGSGATPKGGSKSYKKEGTSLIRSLNIHNNEFKFKDLAYIDDDQADSLNNVIVQENDVLLNITGASVARCCIVPTEVLPARVNQHVCILRHGNLIDAKYLNRLLTNGNYQQLLQRLAKSKAATREALPKSIVDKLSIPLPPLPLQRLFAQRIEQIEREKSEVQKSIQDLETLLASRMQYWFE